MFHPADIYDSWGKNASREDLEPHFIHFQIQATVTKIDVFVALQQDQNLNTKAVLNDRGY